MEARGRIELEAFSRRERVAAGDEAGACCRNPERSEGALASPIILAIAWRRGGESNSRIKVLQTSPLPLGYRALLFRVTCSPKVGKMPGHSARSNPGLSRQKADN